MEVMISADEFMSVRNGNQNTYKKLCQSFLKVKDPLTQLKVGLCILKSPPEERMDFELAVLEQATKELEFFKSLHDSKLHQKCCKMMVYRHYMKNDIIFKEGDSSNEFFIILDGSVNVYVRKKQDRIDAEIEHEQQQLKVLSEEEIEHHPNTIVRYYQPPRLLTRRMTINLREDDFEQISKSYKPRTIIHTDRQDTKHKDVEIIKKLTHGLEKLQDKEFLFNGGVFLHEYVARINEGQMFGERGLLIESARTGTVIANTSLHVAVLTRKDYKILLEDNQLEKIRKKTRLLSNSILKYLTYKEAIETQYKFEKVHYPIGHYIYKIGDTPQQLIVIKKGTVRLFKKENQKLFPLCELGQDQYFGELEYFEQSDRIHTVQVTSQYFSAYSITYIDLAKLLASYPQCEKQLKRHYEQRHKINDERMSKTIKTHKRLNYSEQFKQKPTNLSQPILEIKSQFNSQHQTQESPKKYSIYQAKKQISQMEFIKTTSQQLKQIRKIQRREQKKAQSENEKSLADTLNHLEVQLSLIRREFRRNEQRRFSSIIFDKDSNQNASIVNSHQNSKTLISNKALNFQERQSSISQQQQQQFKFPNFIDFNSKLLSLDIIEDNPKEISSPHKEYLSPLNQGVMISSKHNLFRNKPQRLCLMSNYERRQPKTHSTELSIKTFLN
ncbi:unnamed protein product [Paramecium sonneborni]|uniref:Cyclic nucleotide-binding domain-containing protein n=1 Tax=Paramecium sonneborni TaxID=65129 RepID=A0A8S1LXS8_9CILI|nr:unnamed protein product [Paramecium sonneborni]